MLDKSWFYLSTDHERIWLAPERKLDTIQSPVICAVTGFDVVKLLPKGSSFNPVYHINEILSEIAVWGEGQRGMSDQKLIVVLDNPRRRATRTTLEYLEAHTMIAITHPTSSPGMELSNFSYWVT
jgi:hypothetical protein